MALKIIETEDGKVFLGTLTPTAEPGVLAVRTGRSGRPALIHVEDIATVRDADDDEVHSL